MCLILDVDIHFNDEKNANVSVCVLVSFGICVSVSAIGQILWYFWQIRLSNIKYNWWSYQWSIQSNRCSNQWYNQSNRWSNESNQWYTSLISLIGGLMSLIGVLISLISVLTILIGGLTSLTGGLFSLIGGPISQSVA